MAKLTITTHHHSANSHELEVDDDFVLTGPDEHNWFVFAGKDGATLSVHERNVSAIQLARSIDP